MLAVNQLHVIGISGEYITEDLQCIQLIEKRSEEMSTKNLEPPTRENLHCHTLFVLVSRKSFYESKIIYFLYSI